MWFCLNLILSVHVFHVILCTYCTITWVIYDIVFRSKQSIRLSHLRLVSMWCIYLCRGILTNGNCIVVYKHIFRLLNELVSVVWKVDNIIVCPVTRVFCWAVKAEPYVITISSFKMIFKNGIPNKAVFTKLIIMFCIQMLFVT